MRRFGQVYGARPAHLAVLVGCFGVAGYAASFLLGDPALLTVLAWFVGAALVHDALLFPLYSAADRALLAVAGRLPRPRVPIVNHVRVPALGAGLTFLMFLPGIIRQGGASHLAATGLDQQPYLGHWLGLVGALVAGSAVLYLARAALAARAARPPRRAPCPPGDGPAR
jgi:hypothetical protein